jgi:hypothetical protein
MEEFLNVNVQKRKDVTVFDACVLYLLRFVTATLCAATFGNSYVL